MRYTEEQRRLLWLSAAEITADRVAKLLEEHGSAQALWEAFGRGQRLSANKDANAVLARMHTEAAMDDFCAMLERKRIQTIFRDDALYPAALDAISDPPYALYCLGDVQTLQIPGVAIVGTRMPSAYGRDMAHSIAYGLAQAGVCVISGMAKGIDGAAHEGAIRAEGKTVAVLGSGVCVPYPMENIALYRAMSEEGRGVVVSEYPPEAIPQTYHFPHRNRVISGLCHGLVFVEGRIKSGGMITVGTALNQGRDVFAVPGRVGQPLSEGPNQILREGARIVTSAADVLEDLGLKPVSDLTKPKQPMLAPEGQNPMQRDIIQALLRDPMSLDELASATAHTTDELITELGMMEIMGSVRRESGNVFAVTLRTAR